MPLRTGEVAKPSKIRDGAAFSELSAPLAKLGYEYGNILFNSPFDPKKDKKLGPEHFKFIKPNDLIVLTTRPPLDDEAHGDKKYLARSFTHLEDQVFARMSEILCDLRAFPCETDTSSRQQIWTKPIWNSTSTIVRG